VQPFSRATLSGKPEKGVRRMTYRVFVYGTLKKGLHNHDLLHDSEFFGGAVTVPTYSMISVGFPVIMADENGKQVSGEIYTADDETLARLDGLEREGSSYDRKLIDVMLRLANGERLSGKAFIYVGREDRFAKAFDRGPPYSKLNERGELDWQMAPLPAFDDDEQDGC
jgi:gamma-glutamylcyclotransferase (GGCT)/AIG2-like uncharacterized protein YtfP